MCEDIFSDESLSMLTPEQLLELIHMLDESAKKWERMKTAPYFKGGPFIKSTFMYKEVSDFA